MSKAPDLVLDGEVYYIDNGGYYRGKKGLLHRIVWQRANGEIPKGCCIHHRDEVKTNNALSNLELLTTAQHNKHHGTWPKSQHSADARAAAAKLRWANQPKIRKACSVCGAYFEATGGIRKTCSDTCYRYILNRRPKRKKS